MITALKLITVINCKVSHNEFFRKQYSSITALEVRNTYW